MCNSSGYRPALSNTTCIDYNWVQAFQLEGLELLAIMRANGEEYDVTSPFVSQIKCIHIYIIIFKIKVNVLNKYSGQHFTIR